MNDLPDMGFDDVIAGRVYTDTPHPFEPLNPPITATVTTPEPLTPEGLDAAKVLVALPPLDWPTLAQLARSVAMNIKPMDHILKEFALTAIQYEFLEANNEFYKQALHSACIEWNSPLSTAERIKIEAAAILEDSLVGLAVRMRAKQEGLPGVIEAAKFFGKLAGLGEREAGGATTGERFTINIDLGGDQKLTVRTSPVQEAPDATALTSQRPDAAGAISVLHQIQQLPEGEGELEQVRSDPEGEAPKITF